MGIARIASQDANGGSGVSASISATYAATPTKGDLLIACVMSNKPKLTNAITGWTLIQEATWSASGSSISLFAKVADGTESTTVTATATAATVMRLFITEYSGTTAYSTTPNNWANATGGMDNQASGTTRTEAIGSTFSAQDNLLYLAVIGFSAVTSAQTFNMGTVIYNGGRMCVAEDLDATHSSHVFGSHLGIWSWTTAANQGLLGAGFFGEMPEQCMMGMGPQ